MDFHTFFTGYVYLVYKQYTVYTFDENQTDLSLILTIFIIQKKMELHFFYGSIAKILVPLERIGKMQQLH